MGTLTNKEKADYLDKLELELRRNYVDKNEATAVLRLKGFYGDWLEVGIVFNKDTIIQDIKTVMQKENTVLRSPKADKER